MSPTAQSVGCDFYAICADKLRVGTPNSLVLEFMFAILASHSLSCSILESPDPLRSGLFSLLTNQCDFYAIGAEKSRCRLLFKLASKFDFSMVAEFFFVGASWGKSRSW
jgi:hypothetical protein